MPVVADARPYDHAFFGHPRGLSVLFFTEMWERFSYYGMRALLILFMTAPVAAGGLGFETGVAGAVYGLYTSMVYMTSLPGGWIADRLIGQRRAVLYGGIIIACVGPLKKSGSPNVMCRAPAATWASTSASTTSACTTRNCPS